MSIVARRRSITMKLSTLPPPPPPLLHVQCLFISFTPRRRRHSQPPQTPYQMPKATTNRPFHLIDFLPGCLSMTPLLSTPYPSCVPVPVPDGPGVGVDSSTQSHFGSCSTSCSTSVSPCTTNSFLFAFPSHTRSPPFTPLAEQSAHTSQWNLDILYVPSPRHAKSEMNPHLSQTPARLTRRESFILTAFSFLYTINIAISNLSLKLVTVPFHQVVRAATPLFIITLSYLFLSRTLSSSKLLSLVPVILGVALATYGDYYFTRLGFLLTLLGTFLAAVKTMATHLLQTGHPLSPSARRVPFPNLLPARPLKLHPLDLLLRMSPLAFIQCVTYAFLSGELDGVHLYCAAHMDRPRAAALAINGAMAFGLNVVSFTANSKVGPLSITVAGKCNLCDGLFFRDVTKAV